MASGQVDRDLGGLKCPYCHKRRNKVTDSRTSEGHHWDKPFTRRCRECLDCERRFTTYETYSEYLEASSEPIKVEDHGLYIMGLDKLAEKLGISASRASTVVSESGVPNRYVIRIMGDRENIKYRIRVFREDDLPFIIAAWKFGKHLKKLREKVHVESALTSDPK